MNKKYLDKCKGKQITFKELKESKQSEAKTATAQIIVRRGQRTLEQLTKHWQVFYK